MTLGEKIIDLRKKRGLSQEDLAITLGVSRQAVSKWETGEAKPDTDKGIALAEYFEVTTDWLVRDFEFQSAPAPAPGGVPSVKEMLRGAPMLLNLTIGGNVFGAALMLWGHYWDSESGMTVISLVAKPRYRGVASGIGYTIVKVTAFVTTLVFPALFEAVGVPVASMIIAIAPFCAFLASIFLLPEVFGHAVGDENDREHDASPAITLEGHESPASKH